MLYPHLPQILFAQDCRFLTLRTEGIPAEVQSALAGFWSDPAYEALPFRDQLAATSWESLIASLDGLSGGKLQGGDGALWTQVAEASCKLAATQPVAATLVSLQALAAWMGAIGEHLYVQPWQGHHPGWHVFPLAAARNLVAAEAIWSARFLCDAASGFIEAAKNAPFDPALRSVLSQYEAVKADAERIFREAVDELAWALHANAGAGSESFRAELAALFWAAGDTLHAELLRPEGPPDYLPAYGLVRSLVDQSMRRLPRDPLIQYIFLEMKDRGPFSLREHRILFGRINNRFHSHPLHKLDYLLPADISRLFARLLIGWMQGQPPQDALNGLHEAMALAAELIKSMAPDVYVRLTTLAIGLGQADASQRAQQWIAHAHLAAAILQWANRNGIYESFDHILDAPFHALSADSPAAIESTLDCIEAYRQANLDYWLCISPPQPPQELPAELLEQEQTLLRELRGARFIRLLPHLPRHYRRYGFRLDEAYASQSDANSPSEKKGPLGFDPFDQGVAERYLTETHERLAELYQQMRSVAPAYADTRMKPRSSAQDLVAALHSHH
jgi:hypothetical protein